ncbi:MAG TPA: YqhV family protein [Halanaerobiales bacterium]|nr:YqhV family protein [Halanaerobiales bacterium]
MNKLNRILLLMISLRLLSGLIEMTAAYLMYYFKNINTAIRINAALGLVGPLILILVTSLGLIGISNQINLKNIILIAVGVTMILFGTR